jgi:plastocyanin
MRKLLLVGLLLGACLSVAPAAAFAPPARLQVSATEFDFALSRQSIKSGRALIELANFGEDAHNLRLKRNGGTKVYGTRTVSAEGTAVLSATLVPGRYKLWCSIADHRALGMEATLVVRPRQP